MQGYLACGFIASAGAFLKVRPYIQFSLTAALVHLPTFLCKHPCYFQAGSKQSDFLFPFHLSSFNSYYGARHKTSRTGSPAIRESMPLAGYPKNTRPACTQGTSRTNPLPSCHRVQVPVQTETSSPAPKSRTQCGARTSNT